MGENDRQRLSYLLDLLENFRHILSLRSLRSTQRYSSVVRGATERSTPAAALYTLHVAAIASKEKHYLELHEHAVCPSLCLPQLVAAWSHMHKAPRYDCKQRNVGEGAARIVETEEGRWVLR